MNVTIPCPCPKKADGSDRHEQDTVTLRDRLDFHQASTVRNAAILLKQTSPDALQAEMLSVLTEAYLAMGVSSWTLTGSDNKRIPVSWASINEHLLADLDIAMTVGDAADNLYGPVMIPLVLRAFNFSPPSPTKKSTSRTTGSSGKRPKPSRPSSISTIPTGGTETTSSSLAGVSSSSPSEASAA